MAQTGKTSALIVGAGVGGLAAALALERAGLQVTVVERASTLREVGFALLLAANAMQALRKLGVAERIRAQTEIPEFGELRAADGRLLKRIDFSAVRRATGEDAVCALRPVLHGALSEALHASLVRTDAHALAFEQDERGVTLQLESGERLHADVLIGADGLRSKLRAALHGDTIRPSGLVGYRGVTHSASWHVSGAQYFGRGAEAGVGRAGGNAVYWFVATRDQPSQRTLTPKAGALANLEGFDAALRDLVTNTPDDAVRRDELYDRAPLTSWGKQRVTLLGDAAHPMLPHAGQGAAQALEDAVVLGRCIAAATAPASIPAALRRYEQLRLPRANHVVTLARRNARAASLENPWLCNVRDWLIAHGPAALLEKQLVSLATVDLDL